LDLKVEIPIPLEQLARRESVQRIGVPRVKLPIGGTLDHPEVQWDAMRGESATLLAVIAGTLKNEAPVTSSIVDVIGSVTEGQADQAIEAAASFVRMLRERRSQNSANANRAATAARSMRSRRPGVAGLAVSPMGAGQRIKALRP
jgi:hypothetical protein